MFSGSTPGILVVEDDAVVASVLQETLCDLGYDAFAIAASADEAMVRASERRPDLVLMDVRIDGAHDGIETAALLQRPFPTPIIYLTAHADATIIDRAKRTEPYGFLLKPVKPAELKSAIEIALQRHGLETKLRERERWFSTTLHSIADAVVTVDLDGKITFMNDTAARVTGIAIPAAVGRPFAEVVRISAPDGAAVEHPLTKVLRERKLIEAHEGRLVDASGAPRAIDQGASPVVDAGRTLGAVMIFRDVTRQLDLQRQLELADRLASLGTMAAGVAHEINNPLSVVLANASLIAEALELAAGELSPEVGDRFVEMGRSLADLCVASDRIAQIVAELRAFSRPGTPKREPVDVARSMDWAVRATAHEFRNRAAVSVRLEELPLVSADESKLSQVFINLLMNAASAIAPGAADRNRVTVIGRRDGQGVAVEVSDTGAGMAEEVRQRVFEPFFTTKAVGSGTGLGLSICHGIVTSFGGRFEVESQVGRGTTFRVLLPAAAVTPPVAEVTPVPTPATRGRILVIDDEDMVLRTVRRILDAHDVVCTERAQDALRMLAAGETFDLILCDVMMPTMTGIEFFARLGEAHPALVDRVLFLSGGATTAKVQDFLLSVQNVRVDKPFQVQALRALVLDLLAERRETRD